MDVELVPSPVTSLVVIESSHMAKRQRCSHEKIESLDKSFWKTRLPSCLEICQVPPQDGPASLVSNSRLGCHTKAEHTRLGRFPLSSRAGSTHQSRQGCGR